MSGGHGSRLYVSGDSPVHKLPAETKLLSLVAFVLVVVSTPREAYFAFALYAILLLAVTAIAAVPIAVVARRLTVEIPFVLFAALIPFVAGGPQTQVLGFSLSVSGLHAMAAILAKATLGVFASVLLAATTPVRDLLDGLQRLKLPSIMVQIMSFMIRYLDVVGGERDRMKVARESRGFVGRDLRQLTVVAAGAAALFIRSYERGERVHLAMLSRGYAGSLPRTRETSATLQQWAGAALLPLSALAVVVGAWVAQS